LVVVADLAVLLRARRREVEGVKDEHNRLATEAGQGDVFPVLVAQGEVRGLLAHFNAHGVSSHADTAAMAVFLCSWARTSVPAGQSGLDVPAVEALRYQSPVRRYSSMAAAARWPSASAVTTRSAPFTLSPPANTPRRLVRIVSGSTTTRSQRSRTSVGSMSPHSSSTL